MRLSSLVVALMLGLIVAGCTSRIPGETNTPPPAGGPKGSQRHPPGLTDEEKKGGKLD